MLDRPKYIHIWSIQNSFDGIDDESLKLYSVESVILVLC
jgi:hypothetical protein